MECCWPGGEGGGGLGGVIVVEERRWWYNKNCGYGGDGEVIMAHRLRIVMKQVLQSGAEKEDGEVGTDVEGW